MPYWVEIETIAPIVLTAVLLFFLHGYLASAVQRGTLNAMREFYQCKYYYEDEGNGDGGGPDGDGDDGEPLPRIYRNSDVNGNKKAAA